MNELDPRGAALYALVAIALVLFGALLVTSSLTIEQRGTGAAALVAILAAVAYRARPRAN